jgi:hypothetical protein
MASGRPRQGSGLAWQREMTSGGRRTAPVGLDLYPLCRAPPTASFETGKTVAAGSDWTLWSGQVCGWTGVEEGQGFSFRRRGRM